MNPVADTGASGQRPDYAQWRERMADKSEERRRRIRGSSDPTGNEADETSRDRAFDPDLLFKMSDYARADEAAAQAASDPATHLAVLDLREHATAEEVLESYRSLAKAHHPDRWAASNQGTREYHERCMAAVNEAYHALRDLLPDFE